MPGAFLNKDPHPAAFPSLPAAILGCEHGTDGFGAVLRSSPGPANSVVEEKEVSEGIGWREVQSSPSSASPLVIALSFHITTGLRAAASETAKLGNFGVMLMRISYFYS